MKKLICILVLFFMFILTPMVYSLDINNYRTYILYSGESLTFAWDASQGATYYDVEAYHYEQKMRVRKSTWQNVKQTLLVITVPRSGHYIWKVRACNEECSEWSQSIEADKTNNSPWWVYAYVAPPTGGGTN